MIRAGILLPRSTLFPAMGLQWLAGLKENLKMQGSIDEVQFFTNNIGFGTNEQEIYSKAEKLLLEQDVDMMLVFADFMIAEMLQPLFTAANKILLLVNFGANFPDSWQPAPTTIVHSLNFCMHSSLTGALAARETNGKAVNAVSYYDGGYRQCFSMLNSHQQHGGTASFNHVTNLKDAAFTLDPMRDHLAGHPDARTLLCLFSGSMAATFYKGAIPLQRQYDLELYVAPMMLEEELCTNLKTECELNNVKGFIPWHSSLENQSNVAFKETIKRNTGQGPDYFYLLGWETGMLVNEISRMHNNGEKNAVSQVRQLTTSVFQSPRGVLKIDAATHHSYGPAYLATYWNNELSIDPVSPDMDNTWKDFTKHAHITGERSGWRNTYLCI